MSTSRKVNAHNGIGRIKIGLRERGRGGQQSLRAPPRFRQEGVDRLPVDIPQPNPAPAANKTS
jgi:hypothetical protein